MKAAILVDEGNATQQFRQLGIYGLKNWKFFFDTIKNQLVKDFQQIDVSYHFYGCLPPKSYNQKMFYDRKRFFNRLVAEGIHVHNGLCVLDQGNLKEKGVDILLGLDLFEFSLNNIDILFLFSGDSDLVPAIERAKTRSKIVAILGHEMTSRYVREASDGVLFLDKIMKKNRENIIVIEKEGIDNGKSFRTA